MTKFLKLMRLKQETLQ